MTHSGDSGLLVRVWPTVYNGRHMIVFPAHVQSQAVMFEQSFPCINPLYCDVKLDADLQFDPSIPRVSMLLSLERALPAP
jgi:hypothetical protein